MLLCDLCAPLRLILQCAYADDACNAAKTSRIGPNWRSNLREVHSPILQLAPGAATCDPQANHKPTASQRVATHARPSCDLNPPPCEPAFTSTRHTGVLISQWRTFCRIGPGPSAPGRSHRFTSSLPVRKASCSSMPQRREERRVSVGLRALRPSRLCVSWVGPFWLRPGRAGIVSASHDNQLMKKLTTSLCYASAVVSCLAANPTFTIDVSHPAGTVSPRLYGLMTEEINHSYDGGLYAELIRNRAFLDDATTPAYWFVVDAGGAEASDRARLRPSLQSSTHCQPAPDGHQGHTPAAGQRRQHCVIGAFRSNPIPVTAPLFWLRPIPVFPARLLLPSRVKTEAPVMPRQSFPASRPNGRSSDLTLKTGKVAPTARTRFVNTLDQPGTVWFGLVFALPADLE